MFGGEGFVGVVWLCLGGGGGGGCASSIPRVNMVRDLSSHLQYIS